MADIKLEKISVYGFKSIRALENFEIRPLNVLIGANGAGKSNFIALFRLLDALSQSRLAIYSATIGAERLLYYGRKQTEKISISLQFGSSNPLYLKAYSIDLIPALDESFVLSREALKYGNGVTAEHKSDSGKEASLFLRATPDGHQRTIPLWQIYHFHDTSETAKLKGRQDLHDNRGLASDAANLAPFLYYLQQKHPQHYRQIVDIVQLVAPFFDDFILEPLLLAREEIRLEWRDKSGLNGRFTAHDLSDGTLRFICLATLLLQPELPNLILIDEPELGLHPAAVTLLGDLLKRASLKTQVVVSTQSAALVDEFSPEEVVIVERHDKQSTFERLSTSALADWLEDYSLGQLWNKNVLGGRPQREVYP